MTTEGRQPIDGAISPLPLERVGERLERLREESGLTWPGLAARMVVADRGAIPLRRAERCRTVPGQRGILALMGELNGGDDLNGNYGPEGEGG
ncbi:MAG: hypothetical protein F4X66_19410 [Chloroflexi bacterium]|nr:hypothetical protein [Chloroflexota bacterium]